MARDNSNNSRASKGGFSEKGSQDSQYIQIDQTDQGAHQDAQESQSNQSNQESQSDQGQDHGYERGQDYGQERGQEYGQNHGQEHDDQDRDRSQYYEFQNQDRDVLSRRSLGQEQGAAQSSLSDKTADSDKTASYEQTPPSDKTIPYERTTQLDKTASYERTPQSDKTGRSDKRGRHKRAASHTSSGRFKDAASSGQTTQIIESTHSGAQSEEEAQDNTQIATSKRRPGPIARLVNRWFDRVMGAVKGGGFSGQEEEYAAHRTTRDFVWNTIGAGSWGLVLPILSMVTTQLAGTEQAGMVSMAFTVGLLLMFIGNFGVRTYQVSDLDEVYSFNDYQINRWITCVIMILVGVIYCAIRGYSPEMFTISMGVFVYRMIDGLADVYEGRLQQMDKLYLAGISQAIRSISALIVFSLVLLFSSSAAIASVVMAVVAGISFVAVTYPLALLETPRSRKASLSSVLKLLSTTFPLFLAIFLFNLIDSMPRFIMESLLPYDNQLYFTALYFPAQGILMVAQLVYKPLLVRMAGVWHDSSKRRRFDIILVGILLLVIAMTAVTALIMMWIGVPILGFLYGFDFEDLRGLMLIMVVAGGVVAAIDFLYQVITIMRRQRDVTPLYLVTFGFSIFVPLLLIWFTGLPGSILGYLIVMTILFVLLVWEYLRIRRDLAQHPEQVANDETDGYYVTESPAASTNRNGLQDRDIQTNQGNQEEKEEKLRPSEIRAERLKREEVMNRRTKNRKS